MNRFSATFCMTQGRGCDCCVDTWKYTADVFAENETEAKNLLRRANRIEKLKNEGIAQNVPTSSVVIVSEENISR